MLVKIIIKNESSKAIIVNSDSNIIERINELEPYVTEGSCLKICIINTTNNDQYTYEFEYFSGSKLSPKKWLLENILYFITCEEMEEINKNSFDNIIRLMFEEYNKI